MSDEKQRVPAVILLEIDKRITHYRSRESRFRHESNHGESQAVLFEDCAAMIALELTNLRDAITKTDKPHHRPKDHMQHTSARIRDDILTAALAELNELFERKQNELDPWDSDNYQYDAGYTSGLAKALAIIETHTNRGE